MPPNLREVFAENEPLGEIASLFSAKCLAIVLPSASYSVAFFALKVFKLVLWIMKRYRTCRGIVCDIHTSIRQIPG